MRGWEIHSANWGVIFQTTLFLVSLSSFFLSYFSGNILYRTKKKINIVDNSKYNGLVFIHTSPRSAPRARRRKQCRRLMDGIIFSQNAYVDCCCARVDEAQIRRGDILGEEEEGFYVH